MNKLSEIFKNKALVGFLTAGDPDMDSCKDFIMQMVRAGADVIEIGIPFSDPIAEDEIVQTSAFRALKAGTTVEGVFELVKSLRENTNVPVIFSTYLNPVFNYGYEFFFKKCSELGVCGVIIPDLPYEEKSEIQEFSDKYKVDIIPVLAAKSSGRMSKIALGARGFIHLMSSLNPSSPKKDDIQKLKKTAEEIKNITKTPCATVFGEPSFNDIKIANEISQGVVIGSAIVKIIAEHGKNASEKIYDYVKSIKNAF